MATVLNRAGLHSQQAIVILPRFLRIISLVYTLQLHDFPRSTSSGKSGLERRASSHSRNLSQMDPWLWAWAQLMTFPQVTSLWRWCPFLLTDWIRTISDRITELQMWGRSRAVEIFSPRGPWCAHLPPSHQLWNTGRCSLGQTSEKTPSSFSSRIVSTVLALVPWLREPPSGILPRKEKICSKMTYCPFIEKLTNSNSSFSGF